MPTRRWLPRPRLAATRTGRFFRARLGREGSRLVVVWASLVAVACGLFAASFATWLVWLGSRPLDHDELIASIGELYPDEKPSQYESADPPAVFVMYGGPLNWDNISMVVFPEGGEYGLATTSAGFDHVPADSRAAALTELQQRLLATGWDANRPSYSPSYGCDRCDPASIPDNVTVSARRGDNILDVRIHAVGTTPDVLFELSRTTPWGVYPAGLAGLLLGAVGGLLLFGWGSRRLERAHRVDRRLVSYLFGFGLVLWWVPIGFGMPVALAYHLSDSPHRWAPLWEWYGQPALSFLFLAACAAMILALGLCALPSAIPAGIPPPRGPVARSGQDRIRED